MPPECRPAGSCCTLTSAQARAQHQPRNQPDRARGSECPMKAMVYRRTGGPEVIAAEDIEIPKPGPGEVQVRLAVSGVNPTDWKNRQGDGSGAAPAEGWQIPDQDGSGLVVAVGEGVDPARVNERVWLWESA